MKLTCFAGLPGSGKTYAARRMEESTGALLISRDELRAKLFDPPAFSEDEKQVTFKVMLLLAESHLRQGREVILEGMPFSRRRERDAAREIAKHTGAEFELYHCVCPDEAALERIAAQSHEHPAADRGEELYYRVKARFEPIGEDEEAIILAT